MTSYLNLYPSELWESQSEIKGRNRGDTERCVEGDGEAMWEDWGRKKGNGMAYHLSFFKISDILLNMYIFFISEQIPEQVLSVFIRKIY